MKPQIQASDREIEKQNRLFDLRKAHIKWKEQNSKEGEQMSTKSTHGICPDCGQQKTLKRVYGKIICNSCVVVRGQVTNHIDSVIGIINDLKPEVLGGESSEDFAKLKKEFSSLEGVYQSLVNDHAELREKVKSPSHIPEWKMVYAGMEALLIHRSRTLYDLLEENAQLQKHSITQDSEAGRDAEVQQEAIKALDSENQRLSEEVETLKEAVLRSKRVAASVMKCNSKTQAGADLAWWLLHGVSTGKVIDLPEDTITAIREAV